MIHFFYRSHAKKPESGLFSDRPIRLTECCTQFKSPGKILCVLYLHYNVDMEIPETKRFIPKGFE